jgi:uncharacterized protein YcbK (DUF882 family)
MSSSSRRWTLAALCAGLGAPPRSAQADRPPPLAFAPPDGPTGRAGAVRSSPEKKDRAPVTTVALRPAAATLASVHLREAIVFDPIEPVNPSRPRRIDWLLRDRTNWRFATMDDRTLRAVRATAERFSAARVEVISGYRSDTMNEMLRKKGRHVAQRSQHPRGTAVDFRLVGLRMEPVFRALEREHPGGVGRYRDDAFVHLDAGPRRRWRGE